MDTMLAAYLGVPEPNASASEAEKLALWNDERKQALTKARAPSKSNSIRTACEEHSNSIRTACEQHSNSIRTAFEEHSNSIRTAFARHSHGI